MKSEEVNGVVVRIPEVEDYIAYMAEHPGWINADRRALMEKVVRPTLMREDVTFDRETYDKCIRFCEKNYYPLFPFQKFLYAMAFLYDQLDRPVFSKFVILMGRGNGKDGFAVPLANFLQTPLYGVKNYHVELVANSEDQIKDTFKVAYDMLYDNPKFNGLFTVTKELITNTATGSELRYNTSNAKTKDGKRPGVIVFNELHAYEGYDQINVFESALGKVKHGRIFIITTQGYVREGPLDDTLDICGEILRTGENPLGWLPFLCRLDDKEEAEDREAWHKANPSLEFMPILADRVEKDYLEAKRISSKWPEFMTKRMCLPERSEEHAVTSWENILRACYRDTERKIPREAPSPAPGQLCVIGIDYADVRDFASAGRLTRTEDGEFVWRQHTWICSESPYLSGIKFPVGNAGLPGFEDFEITPEPVIPIEAIVRWCEEQMQAFSVVKIVMDTYRWTLFKELFQAHGFSIESKDNPHGTVRLIRKVASITGIMAPTVEKLFSEGGVNFGDSAIMRWYTNNTSLQVDKFGNHSYGKIEPIRRKNDGFMAFVAAMYCAELLEEKIVYV